MKAVSDSSQEGIRPRLSRCGSARRTRLRLGSQATQPHLEDGAIYCPGLPTKPRFSYCDLPAKSSQKSLSQKDTCRQVRFETRIGCKMTGGDWSVLSPRFMRQHKASDREIDG